MVYAYLVHVINTKNNQFESYQREVSNIIERSRELLDSEEIQELYEQYYELLHREHDFIAEMMTDSDYNANPEMCKRYYQRRLVAAKEAIERHVRALSFHSKNLAVFPVDR